VRHLTAHCVLAACPPPSEWFCVTCKFGGCHFLVAASCSSCSKSKFAWLHVGLHWQRISRPPTGCSREVRSSASMSGDPTTTRRTGGRNPNCCC
jgi:hypothetical protein